MSQTIRPISYEFLSGDAFRRFLSRFDEGFKENTRLDAAPWRYFTLPHFRFFMLGSDTDVQAVMVTSVHDSSEHLNFLYVDAAQRSLGLGETLMTFWQQQASRPLLTIHVKQDLQRTQAFYASLGFAVADLSDPPANLRPWIDKALAFSADTYDDAVLMWRQAAEPDKTR
ncbi:GNAT family N-acetyltransferase [Alteromonas sp. CYL-A6]|uniref:GNAT family N-acetyltransferase n=1 Tax=Alteromonas nitratireducens TaxID=3390813 RepID=UPI0034BC616D